MNPRDNHPRALFVASPAREPGACEDETLLIGQRFVLWALRQWRHEFDSWEPSCRADDSMLLRGFRTAGLIGALPAFANAMDAVAHGQRRDLEIHPPPCPRISRDEEILVALCELAQGRFAVPLAASLSSILAPAVTETVAEGLTAFMAQLDTAGLRLVPVSPESPGRLH